MVLEYIDQAMTVAQEDIFGPVMTTGQPHSIGQGVSAERQDILKMNSPSYILNGTLIDHSSRENVNLLPGL